MNCKPGDIARVIRTGPNLDKLVTVLRRDLGEMDGRFYRSPEPSWIVETLGSLLICTADDPSIQVALRVRPMLDIHLQPLRDQPGADEILRIAGHPISQSHRELSPKPQRDFSR
jgi:hypothetical protein